MRRPALVLIAATALGCTSSAARQARQLYDKGDYAGAAKLADTELAAHQGDDELWRVKIRALLAQGDAAAVGDAYAQYVVARGKTDDAGLVADMAIATLDQGLDSTSIDVRIQAIGYVEDLMLEVLAEDVMDQMESENDRVAAAAAVAVLRGHPQAPYLLEELQRSDDPLARAIAVEGIGRKVGEHAGDDLRRAAADADARVRLAAMNALVDVGDEASTRSLAEGQGDEDPGVRAAAARSLAKRKKGDLVAFAKTALADANVSVRLAGVALVVASKDAAMLATLTGGDDLLVAITAAAAMKGADPTRAASAIDRALAADDAVARATALNLADAALGTPATVDRARAKVKDADALVRLAAARVLDYAKHGEEARAVFAAELDGPERVSAAADLARMGDERGIAALSEAAMTGKRPADRSSAVAAHRSARVITPGLVAALADASGAVRVVAAYQLIAIARSRGEI